MDEVSKMLKTLNTITNMMDGKTDVNENVNRFADKYHILFNSISDKRRDMDLLYKDIKSNVENTYNSNSETIDHEQAQIWLKR